MDLYAENILDHFRHPRKKSPLPSQGERGWGEGKGVDERQISHEEVNLSCGDSLKIFLVIKDNRILEIMWDGTGCAISQAAMSMLSEELAGKSLDEIRALKPEYIRELLGVPVGPRRFKCAFLCLHTIKNAVHVLSDEAMQGWGETVGEI